MEVVIPKHWRWRSSGKSQDSNSTSVILRPCTDKGAFPLRLAREGDRVRIVSVAGGRGFHDRLAGMGLRDGEVVDVLHNSMNGKLLLGHEGRRLFLGGGMANRIQVSVIQGEDS